MKLVGAAILAVALLLPSVLVIPRAVGAQSPEASDQTVYANFGISAVSEPWGLWSDGTTLWVAQDTSPNPKIHAYHLKDDTTTEADEYGTRDADKDFDVPSDEVHSLEADDDYLYGCEFSAGGGLFDSNAAGVVAWNRADRTRASSRDFAYRSGGSPDTGAGEIVLCYGSVVYGDHIYLSDSTNELHAFHLVDDPNTVADEYGTPDPERAIAMPIGGVRGLHREGDILWVTSPGHNKVYAIDMSDGTRQGHLEFDLRSETTDPHGIWSNGVTFFVVSNDKQEIHTYRPPQPTKARVDFSGTIRFSDFVDLYRLNDFPQGVWGTDETIWVSNDSFTTNNKIYAYNRNDGSRDTANDFDTLNAAGNTHVRGICSDRTTMFVADAQDDKVFAYKMSDQTRDAAKDISLASGNGDPTGVWCDGDTVWVANDGSGTNNKIYAYKRSDGTRDSAKDMDALHLSTGTGSTNASQPRGLWSNGTTMFVTDSEDEKIYAFKHSDESQDDAKNLALRSANSDARGLWFDGRALWVVDEVDNRLYVYDLPGGQDPNTPAAGLPSISGVPQRSVELTADVSGISDADGLDDAVFHYQWFRVDGTKVTEIDGATGSTYTPTDDDAGNNIKVRVVFDDDAGHREYPRTSPEVGPVSTADDVPVAITSDPGTDAIYATGDKIEVTATLDSAVEVTGTPRLKLGLGDGDTSGDRWAEYAGTVPAGVLVKNTGQNRTSTGYGLLSNIPKRAQGFTTGASVNGYTLSSIGFRFRQITPESGKLDLSSHLTATLNADDNGDPGDALCTLSNPASFTSNAVNTFDAPPTGGTDPCPTLAPSTTYFMVIERVDFDLASFNSNVTSSIQSDTGGAADWLIGNTGLFLTSGAWSHTGNQPYLIEVRGAVRSLSADVVFSYTVEAGDESDADGISVGDIALATDDVDLNGGTITVAATGEDASFSYVPLPSDSGHRVNWARPTLSGAVTSLDGTEVFLTFSEDLNGSSVAPLFIVKADGAAVTVSGRPTVSGNVVTLSLATALTSATQAVTVIYADPTTGDDSIGVEDLALNDADSFTDRPVTNRFWTVDAPAEVPANWAFVPEGLGIGDEFRVLFLTSATRDATSADIDDYNSFVQAAAAGGHAAVGGYSHGFFAVASTADVDARDNTVTTYTSPDTGVPIYWLGGDKLADGYPDFYDGSWDDETDPTDESGSAIVGRSALTQVWTGSADDGTVGPNNNFGADSSGLGTSGIDGAVVGSVPIPSGVAVGNVVPNPLFLSSSNEIGDSLSFYALSLPLVVGDALAIPADSALIPEGLSGGDRFRLLFLSSTTRDATSTDIADYNSFVQTAAAAGHADIQAHSDGFRAVASTADDDARDNTETTGTGVPIYWLAGNKVADDYADFYDGDWDDEANPTDESGSARSISTIKGRPWTGSTHAGQEHVSGGTSYALGGDGATDAVAGRISADGPSDGPLHAAFLKRSNIRPLYGLSPLLVVGKSDAVKLPPVVVQPPEVVGPPVVVTDENTVVLVKNTGQRGTAFSVLDSTSTTHAQAFTAGANAGGYGLGSIGIWLHNVADTSTAGDHLTVTLNTDDNGNPGSALCTLGDPTSFASKGLHTFKAPAAGCPRLAASRTYFVVIERVISTADAISWRVTSSPDEDAGAASGWSVWDDLHYIASDNSWSKGLDQSHLIEVNGAAVDVTPPEVVEPPPYLAPGEVPVDWSLKPAGLEAGDRFRLLFLSSTQRNGESTDIADYNGFVQGLAGAGHADIQAYGSQFRAVACTSAVDARYNTATTGTGVRIYWLGGAKAADGYADFYDGSWDEEVTVRNESGAAVTVTSNASTDSAWTGCEHDGTGGHDDVGTSGSIVLGTTQPGVGTLNYTAGSSPGPLDENDNKDPKASVNHLYGLSPVFVVMPAAPVEVAVDWALKPAGLEAGDRFRLLFLSSTMRNGESTDIADYNGFVQGLAGAGHADIQDYGSQFRAVACTAAVDARYNTATTGTGVRIYWLGGAKAADGYADFYDGSWDEEVTVRNESGAAVTVTSNASTDSAWTGCEHDGTGGIDDVGTSGSIVLGTTQPGVGTLNYTAGSSPGPLDENDNKDPKASVNHLYGLSPVFVVMPAAPVEVAVDWALKPAGLEAGDRFRLLFLSSTMRNGESTDIADYNGFVQGLAGAGHADIQAYGSQFRAVACTSAVDARYNTATTGTGVRIYWLGGAKAADGYADFYDGSWDEEVTVRNESGTAVTVTSNASTDSAWTGCEHDGTGGIDDVGTSGSVVLGTTQPGVGTLNYTAGSSPGPLDENDNKDPKASVNHLYGLSPVFAVAAAVVTPPEVVEPPPYLAPGEVPVDWSLKPAGLEAGDRFRLLFLSSTQRNAESTDIADYNSFVQGLAGAGHADIQAYGSQFRAVACTAGVDARYNTATTGTGVRIYWLGGAKAADGYADFYDGSWDEEVTVRNESGTSVTVPLVSSTYDPWSGCEHDGTEGEDGSGDPNPLGTTKPGTGQLNSIAIYGPLNTGGGGDPKASVNHLYGLSPVFVVAAAVVTPPEVVEPPPVIGSDLEVPVDWGLAPSGLEAGDRFRLLFLSSTERNGNAYDIYWYNKFVQDLAAAGHTDIQAYGSQFRAVGCTETVDAVDNTGTTGTGVPIYWLGGAKAADGYADFYDGSWDEEVTVRNESGTSVTIPFNSSTYNAWSGCEHDGTENTDNNGSIALGTTTPGYGQLNSIVAAHNGPLDFADSSDPKASLNHLYGLSPIFVVMPPSRVVPIDWALKPSGLEAGDRFRLLFLSSTERNASSTGISVYNGFVQDLAAAGHTDIQAYGSQFRAVGCTSAVDAVDNTGTTGTGVPIYWLGGAKAADGYADFYDGSWDEEVTVRDESGTSVTIPHTTSDYVAWVGCEADGTQGMDGSNSIALGATQSGIGALNNAGSGGPLNRNDSTDPKASLNYLYGLSPIFVVMPPSRVVPLDWALKPSGLEAGDRFRLLFLSSTERNASSTDISAYNGFVQDLAAAGHADIQAYGSQFRAVGCTSAVDAVANTGTQGTGVPIYWLGGAKAADGYADFYDNTWAEEVTVRDESGTSVTIPHTTSDYVAWVGCEADGTQGMDGSNSIALGATQSGIGALNNAGSGGPLNRNDSTDPKASQNYLYGLSPIFAVVEPPPVVVDPEVVVTVSFGQASYTVAEGGTQPVAVTLSVDPVRSVVIPVTATSQGGADAADYSGVPASVTFASGETSKMFTFSATQDVVDDDGESVRLGFGASLPSGVLAGAGAVVSIDDDDDPLVTVSFGQASYGVAEGGTVEVAVNLSVNPERTVVIPVTATSQGGADAADYSGVPASVTFASGETSKTFTFSATQDVVDDDGESVRLGFGASLPSGVLAGAGAVVSIDDDDGPGVTVSRALVSIAEGGSGMYTIVLDSQPTADVTVTVNDPTDNAEVTADPAGLTFSSSDWGSPKTVVVNAAQDADSSDDTATVTHTVTSTDTSYSGAPVRSVLVRVADDDVVPVAVTFGQASYTVVEGGTVEVAVNLSVDPQRTVVIPVTATNRGGADAADYSGVPASVTFASGETSKTFTFSATQDSVVDSGESVGLAFGTLPSGVNAGPTVEVTVSITDSGSGSGSGGGGTSGGGGSSGGGGRGGGGGSSGGTTGRDPNLVEGPKTTRTVAENMEPGTAVGAPVAANDPDGGRLSYYLADTGPDAESFTIEEATGQLRTKAVLDYEQQSLYSVLVVVVDPEGKADTIRVAVEVIDQESEGPYLVEGAQTTRTVAENKKPGTAVGDPVAARDPDGGKLTYYLTSTGPDQESFTIDARTGQLRTKVRLDYEQQSLYNVLVLVLGADGETDAIKVAIEVTDQESDAPYLVEGTETRRRVSENRRPGTAVGTPLKATDPHGGKLSYYLADTGRDRGSFTIDEQTGQLRTGVVLDYEQQRLYHVVVLVLGSDGGADAITVAIEVIDQASEPTPRRPTVPKPEPLLPTWPVPVL
ncbi:choice-of-anchor R domain-containing protein [Candidatus Poriferisodalis sp.]|uniref:choice-of-anchor R domain-containing protein n=1 Tax=Candidatus Poriferisodalis sp. TaxID=3101277 RepID=UPI003B528C85